MRQKISQADALPPGKTSTRRGIDLAKEQVRLNLQDCAQECLAWRKRGVLPEDSILRCIADQLEATIGEPTHDALQLVESITIQEALKQAAQQQSEAPEDPSGENQNAARPR